MHKDIKNKSCPKPLKSSAGLEAETPLCRPQAYQDSQELSSITFAADFKQSSPEVRLRYTLLTLIVGLAHIGTFESNGAHEYLCKGPEEWFNIIGDHVIMNHRINAIPFAVFHDEIISALYRLLSLAGNPAKPDLLIEQSKMSPGEMFTCVARLSGADSLDPQPFSIMCDKEGIQKAVRTSYIWPSLQAIGFTQLSIASWCDTLHEFSAIAAPLWAWHPEIFVLNATPLGQANYFVGFRKHVVDRYPTLNYQENNIMLLLAWTNLDYENPPQALYAWARGQIETQLGYILEKVKMTNALEELKVSLLGLLSLYRLRTVPAADFLADDVILDFDLLLQGIPTATATTTIAYMLWALHFSRDEGKTPESEFLWIPSYMGKSTMPKSLKAGKHYWSWRQNTSNDQVTSIPRNDQTVAQHLRTQFLDAPAATGTYLGVLEFNDGDNEHQCIAPPSTPITDGLENHVSGLDGWAVVNNRDFPNGVSTDANKGVAELESFDIVLR